MLNLRWFNSYLLERFYNRCEVVVGIDRGGYEDGRKVLV